MVNTAEDARKLVEACLYPPLGSRSFGPIRARAYGGKTPYHAIANDQVLVLPQIETRQAVDNLTEILSVPGVSGIYVGPNDLGLSLGMPPTLDREEPEILAIYTRVIEETRRRGLIAGIQNAAPAYAARMATMGFQLVTVASDLALLGAAARDAVQTTRHQITSPV
jgi:4-hydroxy-2-oxoheptanedioate aldolase